MDGLILDPVEVLDHLKNILGHDLSLSDEQFKIFLHDLRKLIRKDQKKLIANEENISSSCECHCHSQLSSKLSSLEDGHYMSFLELECSEFSSGVQILKETQNKPAPSFIRPWKTRPERAAKKNSGPADPVKLYHKYKSAWRQHNIPGEQSHSSIRWNIRGKMLGQEPHPRPKTVSSAPTSHR